MREYVCAGGVLLGCALGLILGAGAPSDGSRSKASSAVSHPVTLELTAPVAFHSIPIPTQPDPSAHARLLQSYGQLPLSFEVNQGQTDERVKFLSRGSGYTLFLTSEEAVLALRPPTGNGDRLAVGKPRLATGKGKSDSQPSAVVRMKLVGANRSAQVRGVEELPGKSNYFLGNDPKKWHTNVPTYARVELAQVYRGVDLVYYGNPGQLEYDFVLAPGADSRVIRLAVQGTGKIATDAGGNLVVHARHGEIHLGKPVTYQEEKGVRKEVGSRYVVRSKNLLGFEVAGYDRTKPLIIDPVLVYSTYLGGNTGEGGSAIAVDAAGNAYVTGGTVSTNFPTVNPFQATLGTGNGNVFVTKFNATGNALVYSTYLGGTGGETGYGIAVDSTDNAYVTGNTFSTNFPTVNPFQGTRASNSGDAFVTKLNAAGNALVYSTYLGGNAADTGYAIAVDAAGNAYVTGSTFSTNFPTMNPFQASLGTSSGNAFVTKLNTAGNTLAYSTYLGGSGGETGFGIAVDMAGSAYVIGFTGSTDFPTVNPFQGNPRGTSGNAFLTKFSTAGNTLVYSTYLGGGSFDKGLGIAVDAAGSAYATGLTASTDFPTANPFQATLRSTSGNAFVTKFNAAGSALVYSTYLGGNGTGGDIGTAIAVDAAGNAYVTGDATSTNFPTRNALQPASGGGHDVFVAKLNAAGSALMFSSYLGGSGDDAGAGIAVDAAANAYVTGSTHSTNFPTANAFQSSCGHSGCGLPGSPGSVFVAKMFLPISAGDFDGDGKADVAVWRPSGGNWFIIPSITPSGFRVQQWGASGDIPVRGDYDGDGLIDVAVWRPATGTWFVLPTSKPGTSTIQQWGTNGDIPVPGDYDGDGKTDFAIFRPSNGTWYIIPSSNPSAVIVKQWGANGDIPVPGDYDGDGKTDFAVFRPSTGTWFIIPSSNPSAVIVKQWGTQGDIPVPGDYDGDGKTDFAVFRPSNGTWFIIPSSNPSAPTVQQWGTVGDIPVPVDYDGDRKTDIAVWRPSNGVWYIISSTTPTNFTITQWGTNGDVPVQKPIGQ